MACHLVQVLPEVLCHQPEGTKESVGKIIKTRVAAREMCQFNMRLSVISPVVWVGPVAGQTFISIRTLARAAGVATEGVLTAPVRPPVGLVVHEVVPGLV